MIKLRKKNYAANLYRIFLICMAGIFLLFACRVHSRSEVTPVSVGQTILMSEEYTPGTVFDRNGEVIAAGDSGELCWSTEETRDAFLQVLGAGYPLNAFIGDNHTRKLRLGFRNRG